MLVILKAHQTMLLVLKTKQRNWLKRTASYRKHFNQNLKLFSLLFAGDLRNEMKTYLACKCRNGNWAYSSNPYPNSSWISVLPVGVAEFAISRRTVDNHILYEFIMNHLITHNNKTTEETETGRKRARETVWGIAYHCLIK